MGLDIGGYEQRQIGRLAENGTVFADRSLSYSCGLHGKVAAPWQWRDSLGP
jgi:hypothetical protein